MDQPAARHWRDGAFASRTGWCARMVALLLVLGAAVLPRHAPAGAHDADAEAVRALEESPARVLAEQGFDAYAALFHADYRNWADDRPERDRATFLAGVQAWHAKGGHAVRVTMQPAAIEVFGDLALSRYVLREDFNDGNAFVGRFVSLARRVDGRWLLFRTTYTTLYYGPETGAPALDGPLPSAPVPG